MKIKLTEKRKIIVLILLFISAFLLRSEIYLFQSEFTSDQQRFVVTAQQFLQGNGVSLTYANPEDISESIAKPYPAAAEGYTYMLALFLKLTESVYFATAFLNILGVSFLFVAFFLLYKIFREKIPFTAVVAFLVLVGFGIRPYVFYSSTEIFSLAFYLLSIILAMKVFDHKNTFLWCTLSAFFMFLTFWLRYAYLPMLVVVPTIWAFQWLITKQKNYLKYIGVFAVSLFSFLIFSVVIKSYQESYLLTFGGGTAKATIFYPENLLSFNYAFALQAFIDDRFVFSILSRLGLAIVAEPAKAIFTFVFTGIILWQLFLFLKENLAEKNSNASHFFLLAALFFGAALTLAMLVWFSFTKVAEMSNVQGYWTYVASQRYFAVIYMAVFVLSFYFAFIFKKTPTFSKLIKYTLLLLALISVPYYFLSKMAEIKNDKYYFEISENKAWYKAGITNMETAQQLDSLIKNSFENGIRPVFITNTRLAFTAEMMTAEYGGSVLNNLEEMKTKKQVAVILHLSENEINDNNSQIKIFCVKRNLLPILKDETGEFYKFVMK